MLGEASLPSVPLTEGGRSVPEGGGGFIENFKVDNLRAIYNRPSLILLLFDIKMSIK